MFQARVFKNRFLALSFLALRLDISSKGDQNQARMYFIVNYA